MSKKPELTRRQMLAAMAVSMLGSVAKGSVINQRKTAHHLVDSTKSRVIKIDAKTEPIAINRQKVANAEKLIGLSFTDKQRDLMLEALKENLNNYEGLRRIALPLDVPPALLFNPLPVGMKLNSQRKPFKASLIGQVEVPRLLEDLAFYSIGQLAELIRSRRVSSRQLTIMYLNRLKKYGPKLECALR